MPGTGQNPARLTLAEAALLPPTLDVPTAARLLGISRSAAYQLAAQDARPAPVLRLGHALRIPTAPLLAAIGLTPTPVTPPAAPAADRAADAAGGGANGPGWRTDEHLDATG